MTSPSTPAALPPVKFAFTKIIVSDLDRPAAFYKSVFGMRELHRIKAQVDAQTPIEEIILTFSGDMGAEATLVLFKFLDQAPPAGSDSILGFIVADMEGVLARLKQAGGTMVREPQEEPGMGVRVAFARDIDGRLLEIVQMVAPAAA